MRLQITDCTNHFSSKTPNLFSSHALPLIFLALVAQHAGLHQRSQPHGLDGGILRAQGPPPVRPLPEHRTNISNVSYLLVLYIYFNVISMCISSTSSPSRKAYLEVVRSHYHKQVEMGKLSRKSPALLLLGKELSRKMYLFLLCSVHSSHMTLRFFFFCPPFPSMLLIRHSSLSVLCVPRFPPLSFA